MTSEAFKKRTRIKICGLTREQDIEAAVACGVDAIGFVLYARSPRFVTPERVVQLSRCLPPFVTPVLLFVNEDIAKVVAVCEQIPRAYVQFHGDESPQYCVKARRPYIRAARMPTVQADTATDSTVFDLAAYAKIFNTAEGILLDSHTADYGGSGLCFDWSHVPAIDRHLILAGGLTAANVGIGIAQLRTRCQSLAVDVSSGVEEAPGIKSVDKMRRFIDAVHTADQNNLRCTN